MKSAYKKTYGVDGLIDWQTEIRAGKARLVVNFSGGGLTSFGVTPATYTTDNLLYQHIIENSAQFKSGKIRLLRSVMLDNAQPEAVTKEAPKKKLVDVDSVSNCADARMWLRENKNISLGVKTKAEIIEIAEANGVTFPNLIK